jgi:hypothetical protein
MYKLINLLIIYIKQTFKLKNMFLTSKLCNIGYNKILYRNMMNIENLISLPVQYRTE